MNEVDYDLIEQYIEGKLKNNDLINFENRLKTDTQLMEELTLRQDMEHFLAKKKEKDALKKELPNISKTFFQKPEKELEQEAKIVQLKPFYKKRTFILGGVAAAFLLFFMIQFLLPKDSLYEQYKGEYQLALAVKGDNDLDLGKLEKEYAAGNYEYAQEQLVLYLNQNPTDTRAQIAQAIVLIELEKAEQARKMLSAIANDPTKMLFKNTATWYLAMSYLKEENYSEVRKYLIQIMEGKYSEQAQELLTKITQK